MSKWRPDTSKNEIGYNPGFTPWVNQVDELLRSLGHLDQDERRPPLLPENERGVPTEGSTRGWSYARGVITAGYLERPDAVVDHVVALTFLAPANAPDAAQFMATHNVPMTASGAQDAARMIARFVQGGFEAI